MVDPKPADPKPANPDDLRPRERLLAHGPATLADAELLAVLLRTGRPGEGVLAMAARVLQQLGGASGLLAHDDASLPQLQALGNARRATIAAAMELARRATHGAARTRSAADHPATMKRLAALELAGRPRETFAVAFLDAAMRLIAWEHLFHGTLDAASVWPREVLRRALAHGAKAVVLAHNHPSGLAEPSAADLALTSQLRRALALVDIGVLDHLIVGDGIVQSLAERGAMPA